MKILGLDIGTTTVSAVVMEAGQVLFSLTRPNDSFLPGCRSWEKLQDPEAIRKTALSAVDTLFDMFPDIVGIGVTGQMHGIVYLDRHGRPVSPLYTWQDGRGEERMKNGRTYAAHLRELTGYPAATGYGLVTHYYNQENGLVPEDAAVFCTIHDYIAMVLADKTTPVTDAGDAASLGFFQAEKGRFDFDALKKMGVNISLLPALAEDPALGLYRGKATVYVPVGDNQASFLGATGGDLHCMLANVGTGSQFSVYSEQYISCDGLETRPFPGGGYLLVGASLCGGRAYALLERFFRETGKMLGCHMDSAYEAMERLLSGTEKPRDIPTVEPLFQGTRQDPSVRGSIGELDTENFTPLHLIWGMMEGMARELSEMYGRFLASGGTPVKLIGSGNGLRKNSHLQRCFTDLFGQTLVMSRCVEEAASGAALFAANNKIS